MTNCEKLAEKIFPEKWDGIILTGQDAEDILCRKIKIKNSKTKSKLGHKYWTHDKLQNLITTRGKPINEPWNLEEGGQNLLAWENNRSTSSPPDEIISFNINIFEKTRTNRASSIHIYNNFMWVNPEKRKKNLGHHLAAHFINYLLECHIDLSTVSQRGIEVTYDADFYTRGGERLSNHISNYLKYMQEAWTIDRYNLCWPIREINIATDY